MVPECLISSARIHSSPASSDCLLDNLVRSVQVERSTRLVVLLLAETLDHETCFLRHMVALSAHRARVGEVFLLLSFFNLDVSRSNYKGLAWVQDSWCFFVSSRLRCIGHRARELPQFTGS